MPILNRADLAGGPVSRLRHEIAGSHLLRIPRSENPDLGHPATILPEPLLVPRKSPSVVRCDNLISWETEQANALFS
jgi:hypothetical protein